MKTGNDLTLLIGDKNLSSWSMRPWLALKATGLPFKEIKIQLDTPKTASEIKKYSDSGKVPVLIHNGLTVTDSLAICEYFAELAPKSLLWPKDPAARAQARSYAAEMHSSFTSLRGQLSMDIRLRTDLRHYLPSTISDIERILSIWTQCLKKSKGPFLFGEFGIVDAFYAPVVLRFLSYGVKIKDLKILQYMKAIQNHKDVKAWVSEALKENGYEVKF